MASLSTKRKARNILAHPLTYIIASIIILAILVTLILALWPSTSTPQDIYEVTEIDVLSLETFTSSQVAVKGVILGMEREDVIKRLGQPDEETLISNAVTNLEFGSSLGLEETGIIVQMVNGKVGKMTLKPMFNNFLHGETKVDHTKEELLLFLGAPDKADILPIMPGSTEAFRLFTYYGKGIEVATRKDTQIALSFVA